MKPTPMPTPIQAPAIDLIVDDEPVAPTGLGTGVGEVGPFQPVLGLDSGVEVKNEDVDIREIEMNVGVDVDTDTSTRIRRMLKNPSLWYVILLILAAAFVIDYP